MTCRQPTQPRQPEGVLPWSRDMCQRARMSFAISPPEHNEVGVRGNSAPDSAGVRLELRTVHPVRAVQWTPQGNEPNNVETCRLHYGALAINDRGRLLGMMCAQPAGEGDEPQVSYGTMFIQPADATDETIKPGRVGIDFEHPSPWVTEAHLHSDALRCEIPR